MFSPRRTPQLTYGLRLRTLTRLVLYGKGRPQSCSSLACSVNTLLYTLLSLHEYLKKKTKHLARKLSRDTYARQHATLRVARRAPTRERTLLA